MFSKDSEGTKTKKLYIAVLGYVRYILKAGKLDNTESLRTSLV